MFIHVNVNKLFDQEALNLSYRDSNVVDTSNIKDEITFVPHQLYIRIYMPKVSGFKEHKVMLNYCLTAASGSTELEQVLLLKLT